jgi:hypothetical protein
MALAAVLTLVSLQGGRAQGTDPADLAFWQSIQGSADPAEYQTYLDAFPNGRFAALARIRARATAPAAAAPKGDAAPPQLAPVVAASTPDQQDQPAPPPERMTVTPALGRVGQIITFGCSEFPDPTTFDLLVVVPAGTPEMDPGRSREDTKIVWSDYAMNCKRAGSIKGGPFAPGRYEIRFVTMLYNNEHRYEVRTRTPFSIR